jgi:hypothetical protein
VPKDVEFRSSERNPDRSGSNHNGGEYRVAFRSFAALRMTARNRVRRAFLWAYKKRRVKNGKNKHNNRLMSTIF